MRSHVAPLMCSNTECYARSHSHARGHMHSHRESTGLVGLARVHIPRMGLLARDSHGARSRDRRDNREQPPTGEGYFARGETIR